MNLEHNAHIAINGKVRKASSFLLRYFAKTSITCIQYLMDTRDTDSLLLQYIPKMGFGNHFDLIGQNESIAVGCLQSFLKSTVERVLIITSEYLTPYG